jgi:hypothetical protein
MSVPLTLRQSDARGASIFHPHLPLILPRFWDAVVQSMQYAELGTEHYLATKLHNMKNQPAC